MRREITKRCENVDIENMFCQIENKGCLFEKHFNEEEEVVIEKWPRLINKINSRMLASFSTKLEMNDTSHCCFACNIL